MENYTQTFSSTMKYFKIVPKFNWMRHFCPASMLNFSRPIILIQHISAISHLASSQSVGEIQLSYVKERYWNPHIFTIKARQ